MPNPEETSKSGARTKDTPLESSSPTGHDEIGSQIAKEALGDGAATEPLKKGSNGDKSTDTDEENAKKTGNSNPD